MLLHRHELGDGIPCRLHVRQHDVCRAQAGLRIRRKICCESAAAAAKDLLNATWAHRRHELDRGVTPLPSHATACCLRRWQEHKVGAAFDGS